MKNKLFLTIALCSGFIINAEDIQDQIDTGLAWMQQQYHEKSETQKAFEAKEQETLAFLSLIDSNEPITPEKLIEIHNSIPNSSEITDEQIANTLEFAIDLRLSPKLKKCYTQNIQLAKEEMQATTIEERWAIRKKSDRCNELLNAYEQLRHFEKSIESK